MKKLTERSAKWMQTVVANCEANTGRSLDQWLAMAKKARCADTKAAKAWAKTQGLSTVYQSAVAELLWPAPGGDDALVDAQYSGARAALRPIYDALADAARTLGDDVEIMPRESQVTFARGKTFAVVRAAARDRVDLGLKLHGEKGTRRLVADTQAETSDPSHIVGIASVGEVDDELRRWLRAAYDRT